MEIFSIDPKKATVTHYSKFIDNIRYIPLETPGPEALLGGGIHKIIYTKNRYFIFDEKKIMVFDSKGKFILNVGKIGRGPGEMIKPNDFFIDTLSKTIEILSVDGKIIKYDLYNGQFIDAIRINGISAEQLCKSDIDKYVLYGRDINSMEDKAKTVDNLFFYNSTNNVVKSTLAIPFYLADYYTRPSNSFSAVNRGILFLRQLDNNIYFIDNDDRIFIKYKIDYGKHNIPIDEKFWKKNPSIQKTDYVIQFTGLLASDSHLYFLFFLHNQNYIVIYDRIHDIPLYGKQFKGIKNDVDFGPIMFPGGIYNNCLMSTIEPAYFIKHFKKIRKHMGEEKWNKYLLSHPHIKNILNSVKPENNPIIALYYLKNNFSE
jgi:hypothetical protein